MLRIHQKPTPLAVLVLIGSFFWVYWMLGSGCDDACGILANAVSSCRKELDCSVLKDSYAKEICAAKKSAPPEQSSCSSGNDGPQAEQCLRGLRTQTQPEDTAEMAKVYCTCLLPKEPLRPDASPSDTTTEGERFNVDQFSEPSPESKPEIIQEGSAESKPESIQEGSVESDPEVSKEQASSENEGSVPFRINEVLIPAGTFTMGSPTTEAERKSDETQHQVTLTRSFLMSKHEITQSAFVTQMGYDPSQSVGCGSCPVERVNWHEAAAFCNAASRKMGLAECFTCTGSQASTICSVAPAYQQGKYYQCLGYRLPTEAEWEYAYRAGTATALYNGDLVNHLCSPLDPNADVIAWYDCNAASKIRPVAGKQPNAWGLYDMAGNALEWVYDLHGPYPTQAVVDPVGAVEAASRTYRGGAYDMVARSLRAAARYGGSASTRSPNRGFRVVRTSP